MHLKVGELARRTGLTVRTLHHYDEIGLLKPSGRSESGYRMYDAQDVARLHAIQALRYLRLPLADIGPLLDGRHAKPEAIIDEQMRALQRQIREATELHDRLALLREGILSGKDPDIADWVESLSRMATLGKYFSAVELKSIFTRYAEVQREWLALQPEVRAHMDAGGAIDSPQGQALTRRWMQLMMRWMRGDFALMERWGAMYREEPSAHGMRGAPPADMIAYMERAIAWRYQLLCRHFEEAEIKAMGYVPDAEFAAIDAAGQKLLAAGASPRSRPARALLARWDALAERTAGGNPVTRRKLQTMHQADPLLLAGHPLGPAVRRFLEAAGETA
ncbi:MerR family transcriptional regulator [Ramlibacter ginsenosidimutans]|uniref:MerR family transcriptional regulator n=1 Tax=Ramlibacter ginsenosidimutans TaxID=502333 RepID=A0A934WLT1_9BURK|nr:MerR family transcriptional regulator [Ramlibacter ginsenosidimutans]MBK6007114.1 MerR family transcriptional regulator [Ramlibacter ginsenosidimutans]